MNVTSETHNVKFNQHSSIPRNKILAQLLSRAGYIESWGRGTNTMTELLLEANLPKPNYEEVSGGFLVELYKQLEPSILQDTLQDDMRISNPIKKLIFSISNEKSREELQLILGIKDREYFRKEILLPSMNIGLVQMTIPDKPNSKYQKYKLSSIGKLYISRHKKD
jgi:ATP-dependent DNA helicase RecG